MFFLKLTILTNFVFSNIMQKSVNRGVGIGRQNQVWAKFRAWSSFFFKNNFRLTDIKNVDQLYGGRKIGAQEKGSAQKSVFFRYRIRETIPLPEMYNKKKIFNITISLPRNFKVQGVITSQRLRTGPINYRR